MVCGVTADPRAKSPESVGESVAKLQFSFYYRCAIPSCLGGFYQLTCDGFAAIVPSFFMRERSGKNKNLRCERCENIRAE